MVSVLLAAYNGARYLPEQLASLDAQTQVEHCILWQDDGSTDGTLDLLHSRMVNNTRFIPGAEQGKHLGAAGNFLSLMAQDTAPYSALCDQDDIWHSDKLAHCLSAMKDAEMKHGTETPILVHSDARLTGADGAVLHDSFFQHQGWDPEATSLSRLLVQNNATGCTMLMNAPLRQLAAAHAQAEKLFMHDWFIALTAAAFGKIIFIDEPLVDYRQHDRNVLGASQHGLPRRGLDALSMPGKAKERIALTYRHTRMFRDAYGEKLPENAACIIDDYLSTENQPKLKRILSVQRNGYTMQSPVARLGQIIFG